MMELGASSCSKAYHYDLLAGAGLRHSLNGITDPYAAAPRQTVLRPAFNRPNYARSTHGGASVYVTEIAIVLGSELVTVTTGAGDLATASSNNFLAGTLLPNLAQSKNAPLNFLCRE